MKIRKGDNVIIIAGKDKGMSGKVLNAFPKTSRVVVEGVNLKKRHKKPTKSGQQGQIIDKINPIHVSNVMLVDPKNSKPTRIGYKDVKGKKVRVAKKSGTELAS
jgi:large subunit ribosomal protein L24